MFYLIWTSWSLFTKELPIFAISKHFVIVTQIRFFIQTSLIFTNFFFGNISPIRKTQFRSLITWPDNVSKCSTEQKKYFFHFYRFFVFIDDLISEWRWSRYIRTVFRSDDHRKSEAIFPPVNTITPWNPNPSDIWRLDYFFNEGLKKIITCESTTVQIDNEGISNDRYKTATDNILMFRDPDK